MVLSGSMKADQELCRWLFQARQISPLPYLRQDCPRGMWRDPVRAVGSSHIGQRICPCAGLGWRLCSVRPISFWTKTQFFSSGKNGLANGLRDEMQAIGKKSKPKTGEDCDDGRLIAITCLEVWRRITMQETLASEDDALRCLRRAKAPNTL